MCPTAEVADPFFELVDAGFPRSLRSERLHDFHRYLLGLANGEVPLRSAIDPTAIKPLLPYIMMVDLTDEPLKLFYRLVGTEVVSFTGLEFTGLYLDQLDFDEFDREALLSAYRAVRDSGLPGVGLAQHRENGQLLIETEYLICPLRSPSDRIEKCAVIEDYFLGGRTSASDLPPARLRGA
jgi:hypothetical protein